MFNPNEITVLVKDDELTDQDFKALHEHPVPTEYLMIIGIEFENNIVYLN